MTFEFLQKLNILTSSIGDRMKGMGTLQDTEEREYQRRNKNLHTRASLQLSIDACSNSLTIFDNGKAKCVNTTPVYKCFSIYRKPHMHLWECTNPQTDEKCL